MPPTLDWIAVAIAGIGLAAILVCWRLIKRSRQRLWQAEVELQNVRNELNDARERNKELQENPPLPTDIQFVGHLSALRTRIIDRLVNLDEVRVSSAEPFRRVAVEAEQSRTISRQQRFSAFRDALEKANVQISIHIERLVEAHQLVSGLDEPLKSGHLSPFVGRSDIASIEAVLAALDREISPDDAWRDAIQKIRKEFDPILKARDKRRAVDGHQRERERLAAANAFSKYNLPPLTPLEKFLALKSTGHRDGFG